ncbi:hypothetical protein [Niveispirillum fermenti]|uniref:hypothetical protein n=1 Tax=Niveispirillum fermenti TaxID=1233113 RepID=UPI003A86A38D
MMRRTRWRFLFLSCMAAGLLGGCSVVTTTASAVGTVAGATVDVAATAVSTTADIVTAPLP